MSMSVISRACLAGMMLASAAYCGSVTLSPFPEQDAVLSINYDFGNTVGFDFGQLLPGASLLVAPDGRDNHPFPGLIVENRIVSEIDLSPLAGYDVSSLTAKIQFDVVQVTDFAPNVLVYGYTGHSAIDSTDFSPASPTLCGSMTAAVGTVSVDCTAWLQSLVTANASFAGILITIDPTSLPDRTTTAGDTEYGIVSNSADSGNPVVLIVDGTQVATPEPASSTMALTGLLLITIATFKRRRRC